MKLKVTLIFFFFFFKCFLDECKLFGPVKKILIDPESNGNMWVRFENIESAIKTQKNLHERYFAGNKISVNFIPEAVFKKKFGI